jgi:hypothetical protein
MDDVFFWPGRKGFEWLRIVPAPPAQKFVPKMKRYDFNIKMHTKIFFATLADWSSF